MELNDVTSGYIDALNNSVHMGFSRQSLMTHNLSTQADYIRGFGHGPNYLLALETLEPVGTIIGSITVYVTSTQSTADIGMMVLPEATGRGYGREAWCAVVAQLSGVVASVTAGCSRDNEAMIALMADAGLELSRVEAGAWETVRGPQDSLYFRLDFEPVDPVDQRLKDE